LKQKKFLTKDKNSIIGPFFVNKKVCIYNGKIYNDLTITNNMIGFKFGEFILTKTFLKRMHVEKKKSKRRN